MKLHQMFGYTLLSGALLLTSSKLRDTREAYRREIESHYPIATKPMELDHRIWLESQFPGITAYDLQDNGGNGSGGLDTPEVDKYFADRVKKEGLTPEEGEKLWSKLTNVH